MYPKTIKMSVVEARNGIFSAKKTVEHLSSPKIVFSNEKNNLKVLVRNKHLGQSHRDILDVLWVQKMQWEKNKYIIRFHESAILRALGITKAGRNLGFLRKKLEDIKDTGIHVKTEKKEYIFNIFDFYEKQEDGTYIVIFGEKYIEFLQGTPLFYIEKNVLKKILDEKNATIRALLRLVFSHQNYFNSHIDNILLLFFPLKKDERSRRRAKKEVLDYCNNRNFSGLKISQNGYIQADKSITKGKTCTKP